MHREISHAETSFASESRLSLYLLTGLLGLLIGADLWPAFAAWMTLTEKGARLVNGLGIQPGPLSLGQQCGPPVH